MNSKTPYIIYSESTPNPDVMKFVSNKILTSYTKEYTDITQTEAATLTRKIFGFAFVKEIFISGNYISIKKHKTIEWMEVTNQIRILIQDELNKNIKIHGSNSNKKTRNINHNIQNSEFLMEVDKVIDLNIRPNIQMDGGDIELLSCENGVLKLFLKGACSGCPSSQLTLKHGIEVLLKEKFPNKIKEVVAVND